MRILVSTFPYDGHFNPTQPIVTELVRRGHQVLWQTGPSHEAKVRATGASFMALSPETLIPDDKLLIPQIPPPSMKQITDYIISVFVSRMTFQVADYRAALAEFQADVLLVDFCTHAAGCLHELEGLPYATLGINPLIVPDALIPPWGSGEQPPRTFLGRWYNFIRHSMGTLVFFPPIEAALNEQRRQLGLEPATKGHGFVDGVRSPLLHILMTTPAFEFPMANPLEQVRFVGPLIPEFGGTFKPPTWWDEMLAHPREKVVHVTQGTIATDAEKLLLPTVKALANRDDLLVVVTGKNLDDVFGRGSEGEQRTLPNVRTCPFVPHAQLLPHVGVMVTNAGYNGVLVALKCGVPLVCAGRSEDKADVSSRVAWSGAGVDLATDAPTQKALQDAVLRVVGDSSYRDAAARISADFATHNGPAEAADELERIARRD